MMPLPQHCWCRWCPATTGMSYGEESTRVGPLARADQAVFDGSLGRFTRSRRSSSQRKIVPSFPKVQPSASHDPREALFSCEPVDACSGGNGCAGLDPNDMDHHGSQIQTLSASFQVLAEEVQALVDRKTILEHKLRYANERVSILATSSFLFLLYCDDSHDLALDLYLPPGSMETTSFIHSDSRYCPHCSASRPHFCTVR
jgi:hypothetical protein